MNNHKIDKDEIETYLIENCSDNTKIYLGVDSERFRDKGKWVADYILCVVIHVNGNNGCKIFGEVHREEVFDKNPGKPSMRLMTEAYKLCELYMGLKDLLSGFHVELHLDLNPDEMHGSSCVVNQAIGYIKGVCEMTPKVKPEAFCASCAADRYKSIMYLN